MPYRILADLVLLLHFIFILFVLFGALLVLYRRGFAWLHIPLLLWGAAVNIVPLTCPLTPLEIHYRHLAGEAGYQTGFVEHYLAPLIYPQGLTQDLGVVVGIGTLLWNAAIYSLVFLRQRRKATH